MKVFISSMFVLHALLAVARTFLLITGGWKNNPTKGVYAADTVLYYAVFIWAGFVLWY